MPTVASDSLIKKIKVLGESIWEYKVGNDHIKRWIGNFRGQVTDEETEKLYALYLLSNFIYFGNKELRELITAVYRDLYKYPIVKEIRKDNKNTTDLRLINKLFQ